jgi:hypothetical protein
MDGSTVWVDSPPEAITQNVDASVLAVRIGMAMNALIAQHRDSRRLAARKEPAAAKTRDMILSFVNSASFTKEAVNILTGTGDVSGELAMVKQWAKAAGAQDSLIDKIGKICGGSHPVSAILARLRNQLGFHWDPEIVRASLLEFAANETVVWSEGRDDRRGSIVHRLASDVLANALAPPTAEELVLTDPAERESAARKRVSRAMTFVVNAMDALIELFHLALVTFLKDIDADVHRRPAAEPGYELSLKLHRELEALYPRIEERGLLFRGMTAVDSRLPHPPGRTAGVRLDPMVCALAVKAATTKRAILTLCEAGDGDNALALARVMIENACLLEWLTRGEGRQRLESYVMFLSVVHERVAETIERHRARFDDAGAESRVASDPYHHDIRAHTFQDQRGRPTKSDRPTWMFDSQSGEGEPISVRKMFAEIAGESSFEYDVLYGAIGSDIVHSGPFSLGRILRGVTSEEKFVLRPAPSRELCTIALASSNTAMYLIVDSLTEYIGLDLSSELAPMKARAAVDPYTLAHEASAATPHRTQDVEDSPDEDDRYAEHVFIRPR